MDCHYKDLLEISPPVFFIYIGFCIAAVAFLAQYLTFPKSLFTDLSNMKSSGYPRILTPELEKEFGPDFRKIVSYFFQLDYVTYALLMYILYSVLVVLLLVSCCFDSIPIHNPTCCLWNITIIYVFLRMVLVVNGAFSKQDGEYTRGSGYWTPSERVRLALTELVLLIVLFLGIIYSTTLKTGLTLFVWLIMVLVLMFGWHLYVTAHVGPVTRLLKMWTSLAEKTATGRIRSE